MKTKRHSILIVTAVIFGVLLMIPGLGLAKYPYKTLDDLLKAIKAEPGKLSYSTSGPSAKAGQPLSVA